MNAFLAQSILPVAIGNGEDTLWMQLLVFVVLAASWGTYNFVKKQPDRFKAFKQNLARNKNRINLNKFRRQLLPKLKENHPPKSFPDKRPAEIPQVRQIPLPVPDNEKTKNLHSGMELLELNFLLSVVENTNGSNPKDVTMRKLNFSELARREKLSLLGSSVLKIYAINQSNLYGKDRQYLAMKELAKRTTSP